MADTLRGVDDLETGLAQWGVLGMKWGVRKKAEPSNEQTRGKKPSLEDDFYEEQKAKYGPGSLSKTPPIQPLPKPKKRLTTKQKKILIGAGIGTVAVGAIVVGALLGKHALDVREMNLRAASRAVEKSAYLAEAKKIEASVAAARKAAKGKYSENFQKFWNTYMDSSFDRIGGLDAEDVANLSTEGFEFDAGAIFKRVSTEKESIIRSDGFFAAFKPDDVDRYKAAIPTFWPKWGLGAKEGYLVNLKAKAPIKVASPKTAFDVFRNIIEDQVEAENELGMLTKKAMWAWLGVQPPTDLDATAREAFPQIAIALNNPKHGAVAHYIQKIRELGFDAVVDINDAGALAETPIKFFDGSMFEVASNETLSADAIAAAQEIVKTLVHSLFGWLRND
jgi:hypothetical protein